MTFFAEANSEGRSTTTDNVANGPRVGFFQSFSVGFEEQTRAAAMFGIEDAMWQLDDQQVRSMREAGIEDIPRLSPESIGVFADYLPGPAAGIDNYMDVARFWQEGGDQEFAGRIGEYDERIRALQEQYPNLDLLTSQQMWENVRSQAQQAEQRAQTDRRTAMGELGLMVGGMAGSMNPNTDPFNFATIGVGALGRTALGRIATAAGGQGAIETVNQITGVQEQRRLLGLEYGLGDAVSRVAGAAVGGGVLQGVGEAVGAGVRRWFRSSPSDPAPAPPSQLRDVPDASAVPTGTLAADSEIAGAQLVQNPDLFDNYTHNALTLGQTRQGRARSVIELSYVSQQLNDWNGPDPWAIPPRTETAVARTTPADFTRDQPEFWQSTAQRASIDDAARQIDPELFQQYDGLATKYRTEQNALRTVVAEQDAEFQAQVADIDARISQLTARMDTETGRRKARTRKQIREAVQEREELLNQRVRTDTPDTARTRQRMMRYDEKMRDLAPAVSSAYARARGLWVDDEANRRAVIDMMRQGGNRARGYDAQLNDVAENLTSNLVDKAPILRQAPRVIDSLPSDATSAEVASAIARRNIDDMNEAIERYRSSLSNLITEVGDEISVDGADYKINPDTETVLVPALDGDGVREVSVRELLEEGRRADEELEAVSSCSTR